MRMVATWARVALPWGFRVVSVTPVSYTHLDVYKRQSQRATGRPVASSSRRAKAAYFSARGPKVPSMFLG